ncbi:MAG: hypothetical protein EXX96DRAFT_551207 [Benjaminiella poitrasii]|nr:MAG: hypothetical protein EXX96DRAFT_551207 [Benjaminiella poitrasii]
MIAEMNFGPEWMRTGNVPATDKRHNSGGVEDSNNTKENILKLYSNNNIPSYDSNQTYNKVKFGNVPFSSLMDDNSSEDEMPLWSTDILSKEEVGGFDENGIFRADFYEGNNNTADQSFTSPLMSKNEVAFDFDLDNNTTMASSILPSTSASHYSGTNDTERSYSWTYCDPSGKEQGPFSAQEMQSWFQAGYFDQSLLVKREDLPVFQSLSDLIANTHDSKTPFLAPWFSRNQQPQPQLQSQPSVALSTLATKYFGSIPTVITNSDIAARQHQQQNVYNNDNGIHRLNPQSNMVVYNDITPPFHLSDTQIPMMGEPLLSSFGSNGIATPFNSHNDIASLSSWTDENLAPLLYPDFSNNQQNDMLLFNKVRRQQQQQSVPFLQQYGDAILNSTINSNNNSNFEFQQQQQQYSIINQQFEQQYLSILRQNQQQHLQLLQQKMLLEQQEQQLFIAQQQQEIIKKSQQMKSLNNLNREWDPVERELVNQTTPNMEQQEEVLVEQLSNVHLAEDKPVECSQKNPVIQEEIVKNCKETNILNEEQPKEEKSLIMEKSVFDKEDETIKFSNTSWPSITAIAVPKKASFITGKVSNNSSIKKSSKLISKKQQSVWDTKPVAVVQNDSLVAIKKSVQTNKSPSTAQSIVVTKSTSSQQQRQQQRSKSSKRAQGPSEDFLNWCKLSLRGLNTGVNADEILQMLLSFPIDQNSSLEIIQDIIYTNSESMDGCRFANDFMTRRKASMAGKKLDAPKVVASLVPEEFKVVTKKNKKKQHAT